MKNQQGIITRRLIAFAIGAIVLATTASCAMAPAPGEGFDKKRAAQRVSTTIVADIWEKADKEKGLRALQYDQLLPAGTQIQPARVPDNKKSAKTEIVCKNRCWLFFIDQDPAAHFAHPVTIVVLDAKTGDQQIIKAEWWPSIDGKPVFNKLEQRRDEKRTIFFKQPFAEYQSDISKELFKVPGLLKLHGACGAEAGCETWAVIVCGYDDLPDTFDEDTDGMYSVLKGLGVPDDHIFFVSPHTTHPGVDRATSIANVQWAFNEVASKSDENDKVFFLYSSHGGIDSLSCVPGSPGGGHISANQLDNWLDTITSDELVGVVEACHSGSLIGRYADGTYVAAEDDLTGDGETNRAIFTSASTDTSSYADMDGADDPNPGDSGSETVWGYVEAFSVASADTDGDGEISFGEAWQYAWDNDVTRIRGDNTPQMTATGLNPDNVYNYCPCPDLVVDTLSHLPLSPTTQDQITFIGVIKNQGKGPAGTSTASLKVGGETNPATFAIPQLAPGTSHVIQRQLTLGVAQNYQNTAKADINNSVLETNETNNQKIDLYAVSAAPSLAPDLVIETVTHFPAAPTTDDEITFVAVVKNIGSGPADATTLTFKVGGESAPPSFSVPALTPGATHTVQRKLTLNVAQNYLNTVTVDTTNAVPESNEANNQQTDHYTVTAP
ncbi:MAG: CARDB domain-containing protein [Gammaproteobacteria bacterium]|jgi:hypothetical protein